MAYSNNKDTNEKIKYLNQYRETYLHIERMLEELCMLRSFAFSCNAIINNMPTGNLKTSKVERSVEKIMELGETISMDMERMITTRMKIGELLNSVTNETHKLLLCYRYIDGLSWDEISDKLNYDIDGKNVYKVHNKALTNINL